MLEEEPAGNESSLTELRALAGTQEKKKRVYECWKKEQTMQEVYKGVMSYTGRKFKGSKPN